MPPWHKWYYPCTQGPSNLPNNNPIEIYNCRLKKHLSKNSDLANLCGETGMPRVLKMGSKEMVGKVF